MKRIKHEETASEKIRPEILAARHAGHGRSAKQVLMSQSDEGVVFLIPKGFYQAELEQDHKGAGDVWALEKYLLKILYTVASGIIALAKELAGKKISNVLPLVHQHAGWPVTFFCFYNLSRTDADSMINRDTINHRHWHQVSSESVVQTLQVSSELGLSASQVSTYFGCL